MGGGDCSVTPIYELHNFFGGLPAEIADEFDAVSSYRNVSRDTVIVRMGDTRRTLHQLVEGQVKYCSYDSRGRETVTATMTAGDWIGLSEVLNGTPAMVDVVATSAARLRTIAKRDFDILLDRHPAISRELLRLFSLRFSVVYRAAQDRYELSLKERLLKMLYVLSFTQDGDETEQRTIRLTQAELAKMLAASRQSLNRLLRELEREGRVGLGYGAIRLLDRGGLERDFDYLFGLHEAAVP